jgi:hypothetical protein
LPKAQKKLERIDIPQASRVVKDWFRTRESVQEVLEAVRAHIKTTGETHTCPFHTHTKPPANAAVVYIDEFAIPERFRKVGRLCPCPCCWDEYPKFGIGRVAWFPEEHVIRLIGEDCFAALSPDAHRAADELFRAERKRRRNTRFLLDNFHAIPDVMQTIEDALPIARAVEQLHDLFHDRLRKVNLKLWDLVKYGGELKIYESAPEFQRETGNEMSTRESERERVFAVLPGYEMLNPRPPRLSNVLERASEHIGAFNFGKDWKAKVAAMSDDEADEAANILSKAVRGAMDIINRTDKLRKFAERVSINTLRSWGENVGCPEPFNYKHTGDAILFGPNDMQMVGVPLPQYLFGELRQIQFWVPMGPQQPG